jgi:GNAT superfamily N-acetyltransferase
MAEDTLHRLADGTPVRTRPLRPEDREKLRNGFARLSSESRYRRFFSAPETLSEAALDYLTMPDGENHVAIGAELAAPDADRSYGLGIARFVRLPDEPSAAEAAVAVIDEMQHRGVGRLLLRELIRAAHARGVTTFVCHVLPGNEPVQAMLREVGAESSALEDGVQTFRLALPEVVPDQRDTGAALYRLFRLAAKGLGVIFRRLPGGDGQPDVRAATGPGTGTR